MSRILPHAALFAALFPVLACKPSAPAGAQAQAPSDGAAAPSEPGAPEIPWEEKSRQQRMEYMGLVVLPKMTEKFQGWKSDQYADFKCQTCHGDDMDDIGHKMPNDLYPLPADNAYAAAMEYDAETTKFMAEQVVPTMSELLGEDVNCLTCHPKE